MCQHLSCEKNTEFNVMPHCYVFNNFKFGDGDPKELLESIEIGLFSPENVFECHQNPRDKVLFVYLFIL